MRSLATLALPLALLGAGASPALSFGLLPGAATLPVLGVAPTLTDLLGPASGTNTCGVPVRQAFSAHRDTALYALSPGGDFEAAGLGWTFTGGAHVVADADDALGQGVDLAAAELPAGGSITSPPVCIGADSPIFRFTANTVTPGTTRQSVRVELIRTDAPSAHTTSYSFEAPSGASAPTPRLAVVRGLLDLEPGDRASTSQVRVRISSVGGATVRVDDVYVDPRLR